MQFYDNYVRYCNLAGKSPSAVAAEIGINKSSVTNWKNRGAAPRDATMQKLADYFGVTVAELTGDKKSPPPVVGSRNAKIDEIIRIASGLSSEDVEKLIAYAEGMRDAGRNN